MTTPAPPATAPPAADELVKRLLGSMTRAGSGSEEDAKALAEAAARNPGPSRAGARHPIASTPIAAPTVVTVGLKSYTRPNGEVYFVRKLQDHDDVPTLQAARKNKVPMLFYGLPGCGKTALFEAAFADDGFEYVPGSGDTGVADFIGGYVPVVLENGSKSFKWIDGPLIRAMEMGLPLLVDEVALIDPKVMSVVYSVMDGRGELNVTENPERGIVHARDGFLVFGACNPNAPGARMSEALVSRFLVHVEVGVDFGLMKKMGVDSKFVTCVQNMKTKFDGGTLGWYPQIREMLAFTKVAGLFGYDFALANVVAQAPESERPMIADIIQRNYGREIAALKIK